MNKKQLQDDFLEVNAEKKWEYKDVKCYIYKQDMGHYCGYVRFKERPVKEPDYHGIMTYVPVHGGITFGECNDHGFDYGFDCMHSGDDTNPNTWNIKWLTKECQRLADGIKAVAEFEDDYLLAEGDNEQRANIIDQYHDSLDLDGFDITDNFDAMLTVMSGKL